jgi:hypothetical protein
MSSSFPSPETPPRQDVPQSQYVYNDPFYNKGSQAAASEAEHGVMPVTSSEYDALSHQAVGQETKMLSSQQMDMPLPELPIQ